MSKGASNKQKQVPKAPSVKHQPSALSSEQTADGARSAEALPAGYDPLQAAAGAPLPPNLQRERVQRVGRLRGNRQASQLVATLQRHPGHDKPDESEFPPLQLQRKHGAAVMRAEMVAEGSNLATVAAASAPLNVHSNIFFGGTLLGQLPAGQSVRVLERFILESRIHIETGPLAGQIGFVPNWALTASAAPTSQRSPTAGPENAYTQLQAALAAAPPNRANILFIIQTRLTMAQHQQLLNAGNAEMATMMGMAALTANDILHIHGVLGSRLQRKLNDYLTKGGNTASELRQAFATADGEERLEVARNDALVGRLRPTLGQIHPEVIFGTAISDIYPADGSIRTLRGTNPQLAGWLGGLVSSRTNLGTAAATRSNTLGDALDIMNRRTPRLARPRVRSALQAAPRGAALGEAERTALDTIEERAYESGLYTVNDMAVIFLTRFGRPFRNANAQPKTFLHRMYNALKRIPLDHILLNNTLGFFNVNTDPTAAGSFTDYLSSGNYGRLLSDAPNPEILHAAAAVNNSRTVTVVEPSLDLLSANHQLAVQQRDGTTANVRVSAIDVARRRLRLNQRVTMDVGARLRPPEASAYRSGAALQITAATPFYADSAGAPNLGNVLGNIQPGNRFSNMGTATVAGVTYIQGGTNAGPQRGTLGWIAQTATTAMAGNPTTEQANFEWTARHEMGHSLDLQLNGFSRFSGPSRAQWRKFANVNDWVANLITTAGIATPFANQTFPPPPAVGGITMKFRDAAATYAAAVQNSTTTSAAALNAQNWLQGWVAAGGSQNVYDVVTQFNAAPTYFTQNNQGLPALNGRIFAAHYDEYFSAAAGARTESLAVGVPPYAYTCTYEFFADHYAAYTQPGTGGARYARAVPSWAQNFFDRMVGAAGAGPRVGMNRRRMSP